MAVFYSIKFDYLSDHHESGMCQFDIIFINSFKKMYRTDRKDKMHPIKKLDDFLSLTKFRHFYIVSSCTKQDLAGPRHNPDSTRLDSKNGLIQPALVQSRCIRSAIITTIYLRRNDR